MVTYSSKFCSALTLFKTGQMLILFSFLALGIMQVPARMADALTKYHFNSPQNSISPTLPILPENRLLRGGAWRLIFRKAAANRA